MPKYLDYHGLETLTNEIEDTYIKKAQKGEANGVATLDANGKVPSSQLPGGSAEQGIPEGGTTGQVLAKASGTDYDVEWVNQSGGGGTTDYEDLDNKPTLNGVEIEGTLTTSGIGIHDIPSGGTSGQVLAKSSGTDYAVEWVDQSGGGGSEIDDTAGQGATTKTWSANKLYSMEERIADLEYEPLALNSLSVSPSLAETGSTVTSATLTYAMNKAATKMQLDSADIANTAATGTIPLTGLSLSANKTWTLRAQDARMAAQSNWVSKNATLTFTNKVKYGVAAAPGAINDTFLNGLATRTLATSKIKSFSVNAGANQYIWYALPSSYGTCKFTVGGFTGGFALVATFNHQNESGATVEYNVYRSDNVNLGAQTVSVS